MSKRKKGENADPYSTQALEQVPVAATAAPAAIPAPSEPIIMQLTQEHLEVGKQWVEAGALVIHKTVETTPVSVPVDLTHEEIETERIAVGRVLADGEAAPPRQEGDTLIIPVVEEEVVVLKRRVVREELRITKRRVTERSAVQDTVQHERLQIRTTGGIEQVSDQGVPDAGTAPGL
jgi:uncharacterized protein (TIGR02271 family)